ncbi:MAG: hypothetical protein V7L00_31710 [Nostoc sp.]|uniref:hypothetical protein n=1 Tax=Nostoc sp. TaxID=1180 RepID=UPI002FF9BDCF
MVSYFLSEDKRFRDRWSAIAILGLQFHQKSDRTKAYEIYREPLHLGNYFAYFSVKFLQLV